MKLTCTWSPEQVSNFVTFNCFFWPFPLLPRVLRIDSVQTRLTEARNRSAVLPVKNNRFMIYYPFIRVFHNRKWYIWHIWKAIIMIIQNKRNRPNFFFKHRPNHLPGHWETSRCSQWPVHACLHKCVSAIAGTFRGYCKSYIWSYTVLYVLHLNWTWIHLKL